jgi:hypothetical protein
MGLRGLEVNGMAQEQEEAQEEINNIIRELEEYRANGNWGKFFNENVMGCLATSRDKKRIDMVGCILSRDDPHIELVCGRGYGRIDYSCCRDIEIIREVDPEICEEIIDYFEK